VSCGSSFEDSKKGILFQGVIQTKFRRELKQKKQEICEKTSIKKRILLREELKMIYVKWEEKSADIFIILMNVTNWTISGDDMSFVESQVSSMPDSAFLKKEKKSRNYLQHFLCFFTAACIYCKRIFETSLTRRRTLTCLLVLILNTSLKFKNC